MTAPPTNRQRQPQAAVFRTPPSRTMPSPLLRKGEVYCLRSFTARAEQWFMQEASRYTGAQNLEASPNGSSRRRQPSRAAKGKPVVEGPYILSSDEVDGLGGTGADHPDFNAHKVSFRSRLDQAVHAKTRELKTRYEPSGIHHICTIANSTRNCLDEEYCGHGLVERCMRWIPKRLEEFKPRVRAEMDEFFSTWVFSLEADDRSDRLKELKRSRYAKLKEITLGKVRVIEEEWKERPRAMVDAVMLETPTLGRWPARVFVREDMSVQTVEFAGLLFAVDVCQGEPRLMML